jgi:hypothetical protein
MFLKAIEHKNHHLANNYKSLVLEYLKNTPTSEVVQTLLGTKFFRLQLDSF